MGCYRMCIFPNNEFSNCFMLVCSKYKTKQQTATWRWILSIQIDGKRDSAFPGFKLHIAGFLYYDAIFVVIQDRLAVCRRLRVCRRRRCRATSRSNCSARTSERPSACSLKQYILPGPLRRSASIFRSIVRDHRWWQSACSWSWCG